MAKLYFRYGAMGASKTAQALITRFNYEQQGMHCVLLKSAIDTRDGKTLIKSRIGIEAEATVIEPGDIITLELLTKRSGYDKIDSIIVDECQFLTTEQVDQLSDIVDKYDIPVLCFGLRTDFQSNLFSGSKRLMEIADSISEIKYICSCGCKAVINARVDENGKIITSGKQILIGGNDKYISLCRKCYKEKIRLQDSQ